MAPLSTLMAALNLDRSASSGNSSSWVALALQPTQLPMENMLMDSEALAGLWSSTHPLADTQPPRPMAAMSYVERGGCPLSPITCLACSQSLPAEQMAPGRHLAVCSLSSLLSSPALTCVEVSARASLLDSSLSSAFLLLSSSISFLEAVSALMRMWTPVYLMKVSEYSSRKGNLRLRACRSMP